MIYINAERKMLTSEGKRSLNIDVEIKDKELVAIFGPSGAGKTTLLRMIAGLQKPDKGVIAIGNNVVFDSSKKINLPPQKRNIGFMFQDYALFPNMTVEENIRFGQNNDKDKQYIDQLVETFGLSMLRKRKPAKLSGGQRQRVALARSIARRPDVLLLDEPLSSLDESMRFSLQTEILKAHELFGATTLLVSHDRGEVKRLATQILCIGTEEMPHPIELKTELVDF